MLDIDDSDLCISTQKSGIFRGPTHIAQSPNLKKRHNRQDGVDDSQTTTQGYIPGHEGNVQ